MGDTFSNLTKTHNTTKFYCQLSIIRGPQINVWTLYLYELIKLIDDKKQGLSHEIHMMIHVKKNSPWGVWLTQPVTLIILFMLLTLIELKKKLFMFRSAFLSHCALLKRVFCREEHIILCNTKPKNDFPSNVIIKLVFGLNYKVTFVGKSFLGLVLHTIIWSSIPKTLFTNTILRLACEAKFVMI